MARLEGPPYVTDWWHESKRSSLLIRDLNKDGHKDVFMVVEENPKLRGTKGALCKEYNPAEGCNIKYGERYVQFYYGLADGTYKLAVKSAPLLGRYDGGMDPDAYKGFFVTPKGSIQIHFSGGAGWKWGYVFTFQYRKDDIYLIGITYDSYNPHDGSLTIDKNLLTGDVIEKSNSGEDAPEISRYKEKVKPLIHLKDIEDWHSIPDLLIYSN